MQLSECDLGHLNFIRATYICQSLTRVGHQLSKLNDIPAQFYIFEGRACVHILQSFLCVS